MREIKFRAWDSARKKMWSAEEMGTDELSLNPDGRGFCNPNPYDPRRTAYFGFMIPLQFTGLHDKNGKEIYEGDIVGCEEGEFEVRWDNDYSLYRFGDMAAGDHCWPIEVIGNIYENPELLKGDEGGV